MHLEPDFGFVLKLTKREMRIVGLALRAYALADRGTVADRTEAGDLNARILESRKRLLLEELDVVEGSLEKTKDAT